MGQEQSAPPAEKPGPGGQPQGHPRQAQQPPTMRQSQSATAEQGPVQGQGLMAHFRAAMGSRTLEDVCTIDKNAKPLGKGTFGIVYKAYLKTDGRKVAVKIIDKSKLKQMKVPSSIVATECEMMQQCKGQENFVQLYDVIETNSKFCLVLEFCDGGNMQDGAMSREGQLGEAHVRMLMKRMIESIAFLHSKNICHRDIKPHNYLVVGNIASSSVRIKLGDFGTAIRLEKGKLCKDQVGTPAFMAPEIHLLPNKSSGYDHKVDVWAVGVCMIFLLANEYPFIDGQGRLLRHRIIQGDVPLWEGNAFQNLFQGAQEFLGMTTKRPSKNARDLTRHLLAPRRQDRLSSFDSLKHAWFTKPVVEPGLVEFGDNMPLLDMKDFDDAFVRMERDMGWAVDALGKMEIGTIEIAHTIDPSDERLHSCVVCFHTTDAFKYVCPQCRYAVCSECLQGLPKPICPHCQHEDTDMVVTQNIAHLARRSSKLFEDGQKHFENAAAMAAMTMAIDIAPTSRSPEEKARRNMCACCEAPSTSSNYICPVCCSGICFQCSKSVLVREPRCPSCGDVEHVAATLPQYIAAHEAWSSAAELSGAITKSISDVARRFSGDHDSVGQPRSPNSRSPNSSHGPLMPPADFHERANSCCMCNDASSMFDHVCPCCSASTCASCICTRLPKENLHCPKCKDSGKNARSMSLILSAYHARASWNNFWSSVTGSFGGESHKNVRIPSGDGLQNRFSERLHL